MVIILRKMNIQKFLLMSTILIEFHPTSMVIFLLMILKIMEILILMVIQKLIMATDLLNIMMVQKIFIINPTSSSRHLVEIHIKIIQE